jgi:CubicO group peptidase (beta-lactamase class C family)
MSTARALVLDRHDGRAPPRTPTNGLVAPADRRSLAGRAGQDNELVAQQEVLEHEVAATPERGAKQTKHNAQQAEHRPQHVRSRRAHEHGGRRFAPSQPLPVDGETLFQIASITKTLVATAVMRLAFRPPRPTGPG